MGAGAIIECVEWDGRRWSTVARWLVVVVVHCVRFVRCVRGHRLILNCLCVCVCALKTSLNLLCNLVDDIHNL